MAKGNGKAAAKDTMAAPAEAMKDGFDRAMSFAGDFGEISRGNMAAFAESAQAARKGMEAVNSRAMDFWKVAMERQAEAAKTITGAKSFKEAMEAQSAFAKDAFQTYMAEMNELAGVMTTTMREAAEPLNARAGLVVEKLQSSR